MLHEGNCHCDMSPCVCRSLQFTYFVGVGLGRTAVKRSLHSTGSHARSPRATGQLSQTCRSTGTGYILCLKYWFVFLKTRLSGVGVWGEGMVGEGLETYQTS